MQKMKSEEGTWVRRVEEGEGRWGGGGGGGAGPAIKIFSHPLAAVFDYVFISTTDTARMNLTALSLGK